jgi:hypothetical protein
VQIATKSVKAVTETSWGLAESAAALLLLKFFGNLRLAQLENGVRHLLDLWHVEAHRLNITML